MDLKKPKNFTCTTVSISCIQFYLEREIKQHAFFLGESWTEGYNRELEQRHFLSHARQPEVSLNCLDAT